MLFDASNSLLNGWLIARIYNLKRILFRFVEFEDETIWFLICFMCFIVYLFTIKQNKQII